MRSDQTLSGILVLENIVGSSLELLVLVDISVVTMVLLEGPVMGEIDACIWLLFLYVVIFAVVIVVLDAAVDFACESSAIAIDCDRIVEFDVEDALLFTFGVLPIISILFMFIMMNQYIRR